MRPSLSVLPRALLFGMVDGKVKDFFFFFFFSLVRGKEKRRRSMSGVAGDVPSVIYKTYSLCPACVFVDGKGSQAPMLPSSVVTTSPDAKAKVYLVVQCPKHGSFRTLYCSNYEFFKNTLRFGGMQSSIRLGLPSSQLPDIEDLFRDIRSLHSPLHRVPRSPAPSSSSSSSSSSSPSSRPAVAPHRPLVLSFSIFDSEANAFLSDEKILAEIAHFDRLYSGDLEVRSTLLSSYQETYERT